MNKQFNYINTTIVQNAFIGKKINIKEQFLRYDDFYKTIDYSVLKNIIKTRHTKIYGLAFNIVYILNICWLLFYILMSLDILVEHISKINTEQHMMKIIFEILLSIYFYILATPAIYCVPMVAPLLVSIIAYNFYAVYLFSDNNIMKEIELYKKNLLLQKRDVKLALDNHVPKDINEIINSYLFIK